MPSKEYIFKPTIQEESREYANFLAQIIAYFDENGFGFRRTAFPSSGVKEIIQ